MLVREMKQNAQGVLQSTATYLCGPRGPEYRRDDTQAEGTYSDSTGTHPAGKTRWYVYDGLGSVVGEVDPSGNLTSSGTFDVYGAKRQGGTGAATSRQGFVGSLGHVSDAETGLVYMRARYYDPSTGRFESQDPGRSGMNWFTYCSNDPVNRTDKNGQTDDYNTTFGVSAGLGLLAVPLMWCATVAMGEADRSLMILAIIAASGGIALCADALKDVVAPSGAAQALFFSAAFLVINMMFGGATGQGTKIMGTLIPAVGNVVAAYAATAIMDEVYMLSMD